MWCPWLYKPMNYSSREKFQDFHLYQKRMRASLMAKINRKLIENYFQKNYLSAQATSNMNVLKGISR